MDMMNQLSISEYNPRMKYCDKFPFADLKQNTVPYIAVMRFGAWLLIFLRKEKDYVDV